MNFKFTETNSTFNIHNSQFQLMPFLNLSTFEAT